VNENVGGREAAMMGSPARYPTYLRHLALIPCRLYVSYIHGNWPRTPCISAILFDVGVDFERRYLKSIDLWIT
jgi:hypothetical protein